MGRTGSGSGASADGGAALLVFLGSARRGGNSEILCREAMKGAREAAGGRGGGAVRLVRLDALDLLPCAGCLKCRGGRCRTRSDDANPLLALMRAARSYLFATPVYFWNVSGLMKNFFDRLLPLFEVTWEGDRARMRSLVAGRKAGIIVVQEEAKCPHPSIPLLFFERNFADLSLSFAGSVFAYGALRKGDVRRDRRALAAARALGRKLVR